MRRLIKEISFFLGVPEPLEIEREYLTCLMDADPSRHPIRKTRYCFLYDNRYFELDVYPFWDDRAILELELSSEDEEVVLPKELELIREVTDDDAYKNASLAKNG